MLRAGHRKQLGISHATRLAPMLGGWARQGTQCAFGGSFCSHARSLEATKLLKRFVEESDLRGF
jgi:hypothetical protein